ncbi:hypothetical protein [Solimicrobium silvestre]|uniref:Flagellar FliJ protein n=1 Tax=Solimicrobium silvestre TaxID=2099400 RepID=A0A2S9H1P9_9BURK|nr:hypothetical protein [Solimicrobium silvestre]PRC93914.1 hypothetical protein S2091_1523 [Solimicrobium silvestre]
MQREPRGFQYGLEPLRRKSDWELQELRQTLARLNTEIAAQTQTVQQYEDRLSVATKDIARQQGKSQIIHIDKQFIAHTYIAHQMQLLALARKALTQLETNRDQTIQNLHRLQKFADGLEEHREEEVKDYTQVLEKVSIAEADDAWLRGIHWKAAQ